MKNNKAKKYPDLPFVADGRFWSVKPAENFNAAFLEGQSFAASYLKYVKREPASAPLLGSIVLHMRDSESPGHVIGFCDVVDQHLRATIESPNVEMLFQL